MGDSQHRIDKWTAKVTTARAVADRTVQVEGMRANASVVANQLVQVEAQIRSDLNGSGVPTIQYPFYLNFGREIWALQRRGIAGESAAQEVAVLVAKYVAMGLAQSVLQSVRHEVFNVNAPITP